MSNSGNSPIGLTLTHKLVFAAPKALTMVVAVFWMIRRAVWQKSTDVSQGFATPITQYYYYYYYYSDAESSEISVHDYQVQRSAIPEGSNTS